MSTRIELGNLSIIWQASQDRITLHLIGDVDETFQHDRIPLEQKLPIYLNLSQVKHFNSIGIREWIHFMRRLSKICQPVLQECSVSFVDQINMVPDSLGNGNVESFYAPYYCACGQECNRLIQVSQSEEDLKNFEAPLFSCDCGKNLEFDAIEESYFQFLQHLPKVG
ncbi:MAG: hypothetical protein ACOH5I_01100 [Oligoflexus sp.]